MEFSSQRTFNSEIQDKEFLTGEILYYRYQFNASDEGTS